MVKESRTQAGVANLIGTHGATLVRTVTFHSLMTVPSPFFHVFPPRAELIDVELEVSGNAITFALETADLPKGASPYEIGYVQGDITVIAVVGKLVLT